MCIFFPIIFSPPIPFFEEGLCLAGRWYKTTAVIHTEHLRIWTSSLDLIQKGNFWTSGVSCPCQSPLPVPQQMPHLQCWEDLPWSRVTAQWVFESMWLLWYGVDVNSDYFWSQFCCLFFRFSFLISKWSLQRNGAPGCYFYKLSVLSIC